MAESMSNFWLVVTSLAQSPLLQFPVAVALMVLVGTCLVRAVTR